MVCVEALEWAISAAKKFGSAVCTTRNHFHVGATGFYPRMAAREGCIAIAMSSHRDMSPSGDENPNSIADFGLDSEQSILAAALPSPMSIGIPAGDQPPIVFDGSAAFGADSQSGAETRSVLKQLGLQTAVVALGGIVAGVYQPETLNTEYEANQGCFIAVFDAAKLMPKAELGASMDRYISQAIAMQPIEGLELAELPGGDQVRRIQHCEAHGIEVAYIQPGNPQ